MGAYLSMSIPILLFVTALQSSVVPQIRILGGGPDFVLLFVLAWAANSELDESLTWAFVGGIMQDLLSAAPTGTSAMGLIIMVFVIDVLNRQLYRVGLLLLLILAFVGTIVKETIFALVMAIIGMPGDFLSALSYVILPGALYNVALIGIVFWVVRRIQRRIRREDRFAHLT